MTLAASAVSAALGAASTWLAMWPLRRRRTSGAEQHVHELTDAYENERTFRSIVEASGDLVVALDDQGRATFAPHSSGLVLGWPVEQIQGTPFVSLVHAGDLERFAALTHAPLPAGDRPRLRLRSASEAWLTLEWTASHSPQGMVLCGRDVTDRVIVERLLMRQATHDELTGLPNRKALLDLVTRWAPRASAERPLAVIVFDLDRFKEVNDSLGHGIGDQLLAQIGPRLETCLRPNDTIACLGGDDFAILLPHATAVDAQNVAERLTRELERPFEVDGLQLTVDASFGFAVSHTIEGQDSEDLMREAETAMYRAKANGNGIAAFDPQRDSSQTRARLELSADLRRAAPDGQLRVFYQPIVDVLDGTMAGVEALVRWQHPQRGLLPPGAFLPLAETSGLIVPMSRVVLSTAIAQVAEWAKTGRVVQVAVNMSPRWLQHAGVPEVVAQTLHDYGVAPDQLKLEITESVVLVEPELTLATLNRLRDMGIGLSLDDFGTGYSSMTHLRHLPVNQLKIDKAFVQSMTTSPQDAVIVRAAVELGHNLGLEVVAEGIEDADTLAEVVASGCSLAQGYYFARPMPADELLAWADERFPGWKHAGDTIGAAPAI